MRQTERGVTQPRLGDALFTAKEDPQAAEKALLENTGLIWAVVRRYIGRGVDTDDLYQLGCIGLMKAIHGYDPAFGTQFSTYAVPKIAGEIRRFLRDDGQVKVSRTVKEQALAIRLEKSRLEQKLGREPTVSELADVLHLSPQEIAACEIATAPAESLQKENGEGGLTLENVLGDPDTENRLVEKVALRQALEQLPELERQVIILRFYRGLTQQTAGQQLRISQVQVSRLERKGIISLRRLLV